MTTYPEHTIQVFSNHSLFIEMPDERSLRFDHMGRWSSWQNGTALYRRTLDSKIVKVKDKEYSVLTNDEKADISQEIKKITTDIYNRLESDDTSLCLAQNDASEIIEWMGRAVHWNNQPEEFEVQRFHSAYPEGIQILPPDRYRDLVIQPALGCPSGQCTFCAFYQNNQFRVRSDKDFDRHIQAVRDLFGDDIIDRNGIFLDSASALSLSQRRMIKVLDTISDLIPNNKRGISAFLDPNHAPFRNADKYAELKQKGLSQATIGLETGYAPLRVKLGKSDDLDIIKETVKSLKNAGIQVALTVLIGAGGNEVIDRHRTETVRFIEEVNLGKRDIVYLSPISDALKTKPLNTELNVFKKSLRMITPARISPYHMERFFYFN